VVQRIDATELPSADTEKPAFEWTLLPGNIAYVALNTFVSHETADANLHAFPDFSQAQALILDIRANDGGSGDVGFDILGTLTQQPFACSHSETRKYRSVLRTWSQKMATHAFSDEPLPAHPTYHFAGKVVVVASAQTYSAAEDFAVAFDAMQRGRIFGEPTGGSTGQPLYIKLLGGGAARTCTLNATYPDGKVFVGVGVQPDLLVRPTVADIRAGTDTVLEATQPESRG